MSNLRVRRVLGGYEYTDSTGVVHSIYQNLDASGDWYGEWMVTDDDYYLDPLRTLRECKKFLVDLEEELSSFRERLKDMDDAELKNLLRPSAFSSKSQMRIVREELRLRNQ